MLPLKKRSIGLFIFRQNMQYSHVGVTLANIFVPSIDDRQDKHSSREIFTL